MKKTALLLALTGAVAGCQGVSPAIAPARYPQRDLTVLWPDRHYWRQPNGVHGVERPAASGAAPSAAGAVPPPTADPVSTPPTPETVKAIRPPVGPTSDSHRTGQGQGGRRLARAVQTAGTPRGGG